MWKRCRNSSTLTRMKHSISINYYFKKKENTQMVDKFQPKTSAKPAEPQFEIQRIFIKDLSYEAPNTPHTFLEEWKPEVQLNLETKAIVYKILFMKWCYPSLPQSLAIKNLLS